MKKIMFNDKYGLTTAVIEGRKTMTRRISNALNNPDISDISGLVIDDKGKAKVVITYSTGEKGLIYPHFQIGDIIAIAQPYYVTAQQNREWLYLQLAANDQYLINLIDSGGWENKMLVSACYCPISIRITGIKVERLQDISEEDCLREGIRFYNCGIDYGFTTKGLRERYGNAKEAFAVLIDRVSGIGTWESNPWVFAYEFELVK